MNALEVIRRVELLGGRLEVDGDQLKLQAEVPLPEDVVASVAEQKASIMVALGAMPDSVVGAVLTEVRPHLPPGLGRLSDDKLLVLVGWTIFSAWEKGVLSFRQDGH